MLDRVSGLSLLIFLATCCVLKVSADKPATLCSYSEPTGDKQHVFVMLAPIAENDCLSQGEVRKSEAVLLRKTYDRSGLHLINDPKNPLWTVDWYSFKVFLSQDGRYLVRQGPWASTENDEAASFFADGVLLKSYPVKDIVRSVADLPHSASHFQWAKDWNLNSANNTFVIETLEDQRIVFDLTNGQVLSGLSTGNTSKQNDTDEPKEKSFFAEKLFLLIGGAVIFLVALVATLIIVAKKFLSHTK